MIRINLFLITLISFQLAHAQNKIYISKIDWHVGIILEVNESSLSQIESLVEFDKFNYVDIGWGDADFYQSSEELDLYLATKAILIPTPSVVRIQGYKNELESIIKYREYTFEIVLDNLQFSSLSQFINSSFQKDSLNQNIISLERYSGVIKYYHSTHKYYFANTCNTWVAEALEHSGYKINSSNVITAEELFRELAATAKLLKTNKTN